MFKRLLWSTAFFCLGMTCAFGQSYQPVDDSSEVKITVRNVGMDVDAVFNGLEGEISFNPSDLKSAVFSVSIDANSVRTGIDVRDENLKTGEYLNSKQFPRIMLVSRQVTELKPGSYLLKGTLTIKGISKDINLPFRVQVKEDGWIFTGECRVNRSDFRIGMGSLVLSNSMQVSLRVFARKR